MTVTNFDIIIPQKDLALYVWSANLVLAVQMKRFAYNKSNLLTYSTVQSPS